jgi:hypothetical protein
MICITCAESSEFTVLCKDVCFSSILPPQDHMHVYQQLHKLQVNKFFNRCYIWLAFNQWR